MKSSCSESLVRKSLVGEFLLTILLEIVVGSAARDPQFLRANVHSPSSEQQQEAPLARRLQLSPQRPIYRLNDWLRVHADDDRRQCRNSERYPHRKAYWQALSLDGLPHEHRIRDLQVVVESEQRVQHGERRQHVMLALYQAQEDVVLSEEAGHRRNSRERQQEEKHEYRFDRLPLIQARDVVEFVADHAAVSQRRDHRKRAQVHESVDQQIHQDAFQSIHKTWASHLGTAHRNESEQHVSHMRNRGVSQQSLGVVLRERGQIGSCHGRDRNEYHDRRI